MNLQEVSGQAKLLHGIRKPLPQEITILENSFMMREIRVVSLK
jgi:hypothetical protein